MQLTEEQLAERIIASRTLPKTLLIVSTRSIGGAHLKNSLGGALDKHLPADPKARAAAEKDVAAFKALFPKGSIAKGEGLAFMVLGKRLAVEFQGKPLGEVDSEFIAETFVRLYLGNPPATKQAKTHIMAGLREIFGDVLA